MNGRLAKKLRFRAEKLSVGLPDRKYILCPQEVNRKVSRPRVVLVNCTRKVYKDLKRWWKVK